MTKNAVAKSHTLYDWPDGTKRSLAPSEDYETDFPDTENPLSQGGIWLGGDQGGAMPFENMRTTPGRCFGTVLIEPGDIYNDSLGHINPAFREYSADQFVEGQIFWDTGYSPVSTHEALLGLRAKSSVAGPSFYEYYELLFNPGSQGMQLFWQDGTMGGYHEVTLSGPGFFEGVQNGSWLRGEVVGSAFSIYMWNGAEWDLGFTGADSNNTYGQPGLGAFARVGSGMDYARFCWSYFRCGNL